MKYKWEKFDGTCETCPIAHYDAGELDCELYNKLFPGNCKTNKKSWSSNDLD